LVVNLCHLDLIINHIGSEVPVGGDCLHLLGQFMELTQRQLTEVIEVQSQRDHIFVGL
jgi:hypothetical protein